MAAIFTDSKSSNESLAKVGVHVCVKTPRPKAADLISTNVILLPISLKLSLLSTIDLKSSLL